MIEFNIINTFLILIMVFILNFILIKVSFKFNLLDYPDNRKKHAYPTPYSGGILLIIFFFHFRFFDNTKQYFKNYFNN